MLSEGDLRAALAGIGADAPVRALEVTGSTNAAALALAADGAPEWTLVSAAHQTQGRGRLGRTWADVPARALLVSVVLRPDVPPDRLGLLSLLAGASMATAIEAETGEPVRCKWPNDLLLGAQKVGGVLLESAVVDDDVAHVVVGVGVNLATPPGVVGAGALGARADARAILCGFLERFAESYRSGALSERARAAWLGVNATIGRRVRATTTAGVLEGRAVGLAADGSLRVVVGGETVEVAFGEIEHLRPA